MDRFFPFIAIGFVLAVLVLVAPLLGIGGLVLVTVSFTLYHAAIAGGLYKEPLLAEFRKYGSEPMIYPICNVLMSAGLCCLALTLFAPIVIARGSFLARLLPGAILTVLGVILIGTSIFLHQQPGLRTTLPLWYSTLLKESTRQERRHIGWAWLRLPLKMRMRLNGDNKAFAVWVELVRLTVIYGAYDPNSPWHRWT